MTLPFTGVPVRRHEGAVPSTGERLTGTRRSSGLASAIVKAARRSAAPRSTLVMTAAYWFDREFLEESDRGKRGGEAGYSFR